MPDDFIPERWMGDERFVDDRTDAFQPFSFGSRNCIGRKYVPPPLPGQELVGTWLTRDGFVVSHTQKCA